MDPRDENWNFSFEVVASIVLLSRMRKRRRCAKEMKIGKFSFFRRVVYWPQFFTDGWILCIILFKDECVEFYTGFIGLFMEVVKSGLSLNSNNTMINTRNVIKIFFRSPNTRNILFLFWIFHHFQLNFLENILALDRDNGFSLFLAALRPSVNTYLINSLLLYRALSLYFLAHSMQRMNFLQFIQIFNSLFNDYARTIRPHFSLSLLYYNK